MKKLLLFPLLLITFLSNAAFLTDTTNLLAPKQSPWKGVMLDIGTIYLHNAPPLMEVRLPRPSVVNLYYYHRIELGSEKFTINPGLGLGLENFFFQDNIRLDGFGDSLYVFEENGTGYNYRKSKLSANYIDLPLELRFRSSTIDRRAIKIALGVKGGILFRAHTKNKYDFEGNTFKEKWIHDLHVNRFRYGWTGRVGYGKMLFFGYYSLSNLFREGAAPEMAPIMFGISLSYF
jgi:hypothetical protein